MGSFSQTDMHPPIKPSLDRKKAKLPQPMPMNMFLDFEKKKGLDAKLTFAKLTVAFLVSVLGHHNDIG